MRLLWVWVVVGVVGGLKKEEEDSVSVTIKEGRNSEFNNTAQERSAKEGGESCRGEKDVGLCLQGFYFTATALKEVRSGGELEVLVSLEESLYPHETFDVSLRYLGEQDTDVYPDEEEVMNGTILAREEVTVEVNELRRVELKVSELRWRTAYVVVKTLKQGHSKFWRQTYARIKKLSSEMEVIVQTEKSEYAPGDTVDYRVLVVDGNVDKLPKFAQVILSGVGSAEETRLPWVEVPESGILRGNFTLVDNTVVGVRVTSNVTSSDFSVAPTVTLISRGDPRPPEFLSVRLEVERNVSLSQPRLKGRVQLTSTAGIPLEGSCNVTVEHDPRKYGTEVPMTVAVGVSGEEFEFDVREEARDARGEKLKLNLKAKCSDVHSGSVVEATKEIEFYKSLFWVHLLSVETPTEGNSSHTQATVVLQFHVERRDGGSVEEEEPSKELQVKLLLSKGSWERLRPSATNFSLPIPPNGRVRLEFQVSDTPNFRWDDRIRMEVGDAEEKAGLSGYVDGLKDTIHVTPIDPAQLIRRGDVVRFRLRSCTPYASSNAILSSASAIYSSRRFLFSPERGWLDEVIELTIPRNATEGSLTLTIQGSEKSRYFRAGYTTSVQVNVIPSNEEQFIKLVDQVDADMSTIVNFRLEGMLADSVVSLQAAKLEGKAEAGEEAECHLRCHKNGYVGEPENLETEIRNDSPDAGKSHLVEVFGNFRISGTFDIVPHRPLLFIDVDRKTSMGDSGTLTVTKTFDRLTQFGTYVVSGATFNSKTGRTVFSNSPVVSILPPPVTLSISVPPSVILGETLEVIGYVKNNLATRFEGHVTLQSSEEGSTQVMEERVEIEPNSFKILKMQVTPVKIGELVVSLRSNISSRLTATRKVKVNPSN